MHQKPKVANVELSLLAMSYSFLVISSRWSLLQHIASHNLQSYFHLLIHVGKGIVFEG